ncbi:META domain-containing protein [Agreia pratensis]|uniref:META domain-containing protein n=1 Tax=Agreia pratensis TaxID=150121 RepID=UPI00188D102D|nr:META domain-containing protein [Agreia pratensis]MBF4635845.1 META domain-containing protein [Agreia pratensis]
MTVLRRARVTAAIFAGGVLGAIVLTACTPGVSPGGTNGAAPSSFVGEWTESAATGDTTITFDETGGFVGFDGCNTQNGSFVASGPGITLSITSATEVACSEDVWLEKVTSAHLDGDSLVMTDSSGAQLGRLLKTEP